MPSPFDRADSNEQEQNAQRLIAIYNAELAALTTVVLTQYPDTDPVGIIAHKDTAENPQFKRLMRPGVPIRVVEDDTVLAVMSWAAAQEICGILYPGSVRWLYLHDPDHNIIAIRQKVSCLMRVGGQDRVHPSEGMKHRGLRRSLDIGLPSGTLTRISGVQLGDPQFHLSRPSLAGARWF